MRTFWGSRKSSSTNLSQEADNDSTSVESYLMEQIQQYPSQRGYVSKLSPANQQELFKGTDNYLNQDNPYQHREAFIKFVAKFGIDAKSEYSGDKGKRDSTPEKASIESTDLWGEEGDRLYQLALEEEKNDPNYRRAIFNASCQHVDGSRWIKAPVIIVGGPSGCGKTSVINSLCETFADLPSNPGDKSGNTIVRVDGGVCREVSKIRKLAMRTANNKGYSGISNLSEISKTLDDAKKFVLNAAVNEPSLGLAIPETFSNWMFGGAKKASDFMTSVVKPRQKYLIFARIKAKSPELKSEFQRVVEHMGTMRAWRLPEYVSSNFGSNWNLDKISDLAEQKSYQSWGFTFGNTGSEEAQKASISIQQANKVLVLNAEILNDLILLQPDPDNPGSYKKGEVGKAETIVVSQRSYDKWQANNEGMSLVAYHKRYDEPDIQMSDDLKSIVNPELISGKEREIEGEEDITHSYKAKITRPSTPNIVSDNLDEENSVPTFNPEPGK